MINHDMILWQPPPCTWEPWQTPRQWWRGVQLLASAPPEPGHHTPLVSRGSTSDIGAGISLPISCVNHSTSLSETPRCKIWIMYFCIELNVIINFKNYCESKVLYNWILQSIIQKFFYKTFINSLENIERVPGTSYQWINKGFVITWSVYSQYSMLEVSFFSMLTFCPNVYTVSCILLQY